MRIGHVRFKVHDLDRAIDFYGRVLGLRVVERVGDTYAFLSGSDSHHDIALMLADDRAAQGAVTTGGFDHAAFEVEDKKAFARTLQGMSEAGVEVNTIDNGISWAMYFSDPEGNQLEIFCDNRRVPGGRNLWKGEARPLPREEILGESTG